MFLFAFEICVSTVQPGFKTWSLGDRLVPVILPQWEGHGVAIYAPREVVRGLPTHALVVNLDALDQYPTGRTLDTFYDTFKRLNLTLPYPPNAESALLMRNTAESPP